MGSATLITGGARSGKSAQALEIAEREAAGGRLFFVATAEALDDEMRARVAHHRTTRSSRFTTIEEPIALADAVAKVGFASGAAIIDCLTLWISNLIGLGLSDSVILENVSRLTDAIEMSQLKFVIVTDEVGSGIVPDNPMSRRYRDLLGWTNQRMAKIAERVILMVSGIPLQLK